MSSYSADEIFQFAIQIEENGERFYKEMAEKFSDKSRVREVFLDLAGQEVEHRRSFEAMLSRIKSYADTNAYPDEYFAYIRAFAENALFSADDLKKEAKRISDPVSALEFSMNRELDAVNYYTELKGMVQDKDQEIIDDIILEEKRHYMYLNKVKEEISPGK